MKHILEKIIQLAEASKIEDEEIDRKYDPHEIGTIYPDFERRKVARPKGKELDEYIGSLPQETLEYVAAVMYGGRSFLTEKEEIPLDELVEDMKGDKHIADVILGKSPTLLEYLRIGMELYKI